MKDRKIPMRRCVGCMTSREKQELVRIAGFEGQLSVDTIGKAKGRGAYLCRTNQDCWEKAYKRKALERSLGMEIKPEDKERVFAELEIISQDKEMSHE